MTGFTGQLVILSPAVAVAFPQLLSLACLLNPWFLLPVREIKKEVHGRQGRRGNVSGTGEGTAVMEQGNKGWARFSPQVTNVTRKCAEPPAVLHFRKRGEAETGNCPSLSGSAVRGLEASLDRHNLGSLL